MKHIYQLLEKRKLCLIDLHRCNIWRNYLKYRGLVIVVIVARSGRLTRGPLSPGCEQRMATAGGGVRVLPNARLAASLCQPEGHTLIPLRFPMDLSPT